MKVTLSPEVKSYLHNKHKEVLEVYVTQIYAERLIEPLTHLEIKFQAPERNVSEQFEAFDIEGFKVFIEKDLLAQEQDVVIKLGHILGMRHIEVEGLEVH